MLHIRSLCFRLIVWCYAKYLVLHNHFSMLHYVIPLCWFLKRVENSNIMRFQRSQCKLNCPLIARWIHRWKATQYSQLGRETPKLRDSSIFCLNIQSLEGNTQNWEIHKCSVIRRVQGKHTQESTGRSSNIQRSYWIAHNLEFERETPKSRESYIASLPLRENMEVEKTDP